MTTALQQGFAILPHVFTERDIAGLPLTAGLEPILEQAFRLARQDPA